MTNIQSGNLSPAVLLLDPNNYRFQDIDGYVQAAETRLHEESVQRRAYDRLTRDESLLPLKSSILRNGYIPIEQIVVKPYSHSSEEKWLVVEGNRRLAAVKWILEDHKSGAEVPTSTLDSVNQLPVFIVEEVDPEQVFITSLMGIRHVSGIKEWGGYQRSKLVATMRDKQNLDAGEVADRVGMSTHEVNRRYRAYKALEQMKENEEYGGFAKPSMYPIFHEALSLPVVKDWLKWDENQGLFLDEDQLSYFYSIITPRTDEDGSVTEPKIKTYSQVRELRHILPKPDAKRVLLDSSQSFDDALAIAKQDEISRLWASNVSVAIRSLETMGIQELKNLNDEDIQLLNRLKALVDERLGDFTSLRTNTDR